MEPSEREKLDAGTSHPPASPEALLDILAGAVGKGPLTARLFGAHASDRMRAALGGETHLARVFESERYSPLATATSASLGEVVRIDDTARAVLTVSGPQGPSRYTLAVAKARHGLRTGVWVLSGVARDGIDL